MALGTLGSYDVTSHVEHTIHRRGAQGSTRSRAAGVLAGAGALLAIVAMFVVWYANEARTATANALASGWMPPIGLILIIAGGLIMATKAFGLVPAIRVPAERFIWSLFAGGAAVLILRHLALGDLHRAVYLLAVPIAAWGWSIFRQRVATRLELEQVSLAFAATGGSVLVVKRLLDSEAATSGWLWGLLAAVAVGLGAFLAAEGLGILSGLQMLLFSALALSTATLVVLIVQVVGDGWPTLSSRFGDFWSGTLRSQSDDDLLGISQGIIGSFWIAVFVALLAFPIGIASAVYLEEYAERSSKTLREVYGETSRAWVGFRPVIAFFKWIWLNKANTLDIIVRNLAGVPSVVYGLLGLFLFVKGNVVTNWFVGRVNAAWAVFFDEDELITIGDSTLFAGGVTLAILVLPIVIITSAEAIRAVPQALREGAYGVGATKWEVIKSQVLPFAAPGILTGTLLSLARAIGEAAPLILVGAITGRLAPRDSMFSGLEEFFGQFADRFTAMPIVIVGWVRNSGRDEGFAPAAGAAIVVLLVFVILMNSVAVLLRNRFEKKRA